MVDQANEGLLSPFLQKKRFKFAIKEVSGKVLDFGSGNGGLCEFIETSNYIGYEIDQDSIKIAKEQYKDHYFINKLDEININFDSVALIAVIEHLDNPESTLIEIINHQKSSKRLKIIITTPNKYFEYFHHMGAKIGLFSQHAEHEHNVLYTKKSLKELAKKLNLNLLMYKRFLFGANQICVFEKKINN